MAPKPVIDNELPAYSAVPKPPKPAALPTRHEPSSPVPTSSGVPHEQPPASPPRSKLWKLALPLAFLIGAAITAGTTYALVKRVQHLIANASVDSDPQTWMTAARKEVYDPCYLGCDDCNDPSYSWKACQRTAVQLDDVPRGVVCDGNVMWNWRERYPETCLLAVGDILRGEALARRKQTYRNQLAIIILTVLAGLVGGRIVYCLMRSWARKRDKKAASARYQPPAYSEKAPGARRQRVKLLLTTFLALFGRKASAYSCTGHGQVSNQVFASPNGTIGGVIHGWLSNCYDVTTCFPVCTTSCSGDAATGGQSCSQSCTTSCYTSTYTDKAPGDYVLDVVPKVEACGFRMVGGEGPDSPLVRVANADIERCFWVTLSVNGFNVTDADYTDEMVLCLHQIGGDTSSGGKNGYKKGGGRGHWWPWA
ncbi:hypothetical protein GE09DRAFT_337433 [Coniochaeta sp. 2T2.1]|nr:hypothetical protein GE09DRAFT_337433 [Coniochaeta sp. 2T2.1]